MRPRTILAAVLLAAALPLGLTACSTSDASSETADSATTSAGAKWGSCMRDAGFDVADPSDDEVASGLVRMPKGVDEQRFNSAAADCKERAGVASVDSDEAEEWARKYDAVASCIRENGYDDFPEQPHGSIGYDADSYPRSEEPAFEGVVGDCMEQFAPGSKTQEIG